MAANVRVISSSDQWTVALDGRAVAGFYGPDARALAECHRDELAELLDALDARANMRAASDGRQPGLTGDAVVPATPRERLPGKLVTIR